MAPKKTQTQFYNLKKRWKPANGVILMIEEEETSSNMKKGAESSGGKMDLASFPANLIEKLIDYVGRQDLVALGRCCKLLRYKVTEKLYKRIMIVDSDGSSDDFTVVKVEKVRQFAESLTWFTFGKIQTIVILSQSNLQEWDYRVLYSKILEQWKVGEHVLRFVNLDINSLRKIQSLTSYISQGAILYIEGENEVNGQFNARAEMLKNLSNWTICDIDELNEVPYSTNLTELAIFVERLLLMSPIPMGQVHPRALDNLARLRALYLDLPETTSLFIRKFSGQIRLTLEKLSVTASHSFKHRNALDYFKLNQLIQLDQLREFEVKVSCNFHTCTEQCIVKLFRDWFSQCRDPLPLRKLVLINFKSNPSVSNLNQFAHLLEHNLFVDAVANLEDVYININDLTKLGFNDATAFDCTRVFRNLAHLPRLRSLVIPDFLNGWVVTLPALLGKQVDFFDLLVNQCDCPHCNESRLYFNKLSMIDSNNHYIHNFNSSSTPLEAATKRKIDTNTESNLKFLHYLICQLKHQFVYLNQNLYTINSILNAAEKPVIVNDQLNNFKSLFLHSCLLDLIRSIKLLSPELVTVNLGGIDYKHSNGWTSV